MSPYPQSYPQVQTCVSFDATFVCSNIFTYTWKQRKKSCSIVTYISQFDAKYEEKILLISSAFHWETDFPMFTHHKWVKKIEASVAEFILKCYTTDCNYLLYPTLQQPNTAHTS